MSRTSVSEQFLVQERLNTDKKPEELFLESNRKQYKKIRILGAIIIAFEMIALIIAFWFISSEKILLRINREYKIRNSHFIQLSTGRYTGQTDFGYFAGNGKFTFSDGSEVNGTWKNNVLTGQGREIIPEKGSYEGGFQDSQKEGNGTFKWKSGAIYTGEWENDQLNGIGEYTDEDGTVYSGRFADNTFENGTCTFKNDLGQYQLTYQDAHVISAEILFTDGSTYSGEADDSSITGNGTLAFTSGDTYTGHFVGGLREGKGVYSWSSGDSYDGEWKSDAMSGSGIYTYSGSGSLNGDFKDNTFISGSYQTKNDFGTYTFTIVDQNPKSVAISLSDGTTYEGDMDENGLNGSAQITYGNGDSYSGNVENGMKSGSGKYSWNNGATYDGAWSNDNMQGQGTYTYPPGEEGYCLVGSFENGAPNGDCTYYTDASTSYKTTWNNGTCVKVEE